jgi:hypothetical protein
MVLTVRHAALAAPAGLLGSFGSGKLGINLMVILRTGFRRALFGHIPRDIHKFKHRLFGHRVLLRIALNPLDIERHAA